MINKSNINYLGSLSFIIAMDNIQEICTTVPLDTQNQTSYGFQFTINLILLYCVHDLWSIKTNEM